MTRAVFSCRWIAIALALMLLSTSANSLAQSDKAQGAAERIRRVQIYAFGGVGYAGRTSQGELDYRAIMAERPERALKLFETVFAEGNGQAKSYALRAIHKLDPAKFKALSDSIRTSEDNVMTMHGCLVGTTNLEDVTREIAKAETEQFPHVR